MSELVHQPGVFTNCDSINEFEADKRNHQKTNSVYKKRNKILKTESSSIIQAATAHKRQDDAVTEEMHLCLG